MCAERQQPRGGATSRRRIAAKTVVMLAVLGAAALPGMGCASAPHAPPNWLPTVHQAPFDPYGGWINLTSPDRAAARVAGELLAVSPDSVWVLTVTGPVVQAWSAVRRAELVLYDPQMSVPNGYVAGGVVASLSHGFGLVISVPVWLIAGNGTARIHGAQAVLKYPAHSWAELRKGARFAGGLPPGLDLTKLAARPRPVDLPGKPSDWLPDTADSDDEIGE